MKIIALALLLCGSITTYSQESVDLIESTLKLGITEEKEFYFGFAEGDQIVLNLEVLKGKSIGEVEVAEYPSFTKFTDYETSGITNKKLPVSKDGIYKFRIKNKGLSGKICKIHIQRIPLNEHTKNFNSEVYWRTLYDTTYYSKNENYLIRRDTSIVNIMDQTAKVHSNGNLNGNKTTLNFNLPPNTKAWSYYIGVNQEGQQAYQDAVNDLTRLARPIVNRLTGYNPLAALALGLPNYLVQAQSGEDIDYCILTDENLKLQNSGQQYYYLKRGKIINGFSRMDNGIKDNLQICLINDNAVTGVTVSVKVTAIVVTEKWGNRTVQVPRVSEHREAYLKGE
jgi:hypothetical protein